MSDRIVMELMLRNICEKIEEQKICLKATTDPDVQRKIKERISLLEYERDMCTAMLNHKYYY